MKLSRRCHGVIDGNIRLQDSAGRRTYRSLSFSSGSVVAILTTPWIACGPKWIVAAPVNTMVMFAFATEYRAPSTPVTQTCSTDEGGVVSKGELFPFPVNRLTVPVI